MGGMVIVDGIRYKRARAEKLGLLNEKPNTRAETAGPSGLITTATVTTEAPVTGEQPAPPAAEHDESETPAQLDASESPVVPPADVDTKAEEPTSDTATNPKVTKARTSGSTRRG